MTNSNLLSREEPTLFPISARARNPAPQRRQVDDSSDSPVTQVVQTVSIIHHVNPDGSPRGISTRYAQPQTVLADPVTGDIIGPAHVDTPDRVGAFDTPETPEAANSPAVPDTPDAPDARQSPDDPDAPDSPQSPNDPDAPDAPQSPDDPDASDAPQPPDDPAASDAPQPPDDPAASNAPQPPDDPAASNAPQPPDDPDASDAPQPPDDPEPSEAPLPAVPPPVPESSEAPESLETPEPSEAAASTNIDLTPSADSALPDLSSIILSASPIPSTDGTPDLTDILIPLPDTSLDDILPSTTFESSSSLPTLEHSMLSANGGCSKMVNARVPQTNKSTQASVTARLLAVSLRHGRKVLHLPLSFRPRRQTPLPNPRVWSLLRHTLHLVAAVVLTAALEATPAAAEEEALGDRRSTVRHQTTTMARHLRASWSAAWWEASRERHC